MKKISITLLATAATLFSMAQNNAGIGTASPHSSTMLDISSTSKGLLIPRLTTAQRTAINSPAKGLLVYDMDATALYHFNGAAWAIVDGVSTPFTLPYNDSISVQDAAFSISNTGDGKAIVANKSGASNAALHGKAEGPSSVGAKGTITQNSGYGVYGTNPTGTAVLGLVTGSGSALSGVAENTQALALLSNGNIRLDGGNTNPSEGAVLTSIDTAGNAIWRSRPKVAFRLEDISFERRLFYHNISGRVHFVAEAYDLLSNSEPTPDTGSVAYNNSVFVTPVDGIYAFDYSFGVETSVTAFAQAELNVVKMTPGETEEIMDTNDYINRVGAGLGNQVTNLLLKGSVQLRLQAGDRIYLKFKPSFVNPGAGCAARYLENVNFFCGRLVVPE